MDAVADEVYNMGINLMAFDLSAFSKNFSLFLVEINNLLIQFSDQALACQDGVKIKQFSTRTSQLSGFFNWVFTIGYGIGLDFIIPPATPADAQPMHTAALAIYNHIFNYFATNTKINCQDLGYNLGIMVSESLEARVDTTVAFIEVAKFA
jgi:hypothetical protein